MLSLADPEKYYQVFLSQGLGAGLGVGLLYVPSLAVQAHHWRRRRALAMGTTISGAFGKPYWTYASVTKPNRSLHWRHHLSHNAQSTPLSPGRTL